MSSNIWSSFNDKFMPKDGVQRIASFSDFAANGMYAWFFFLIAPHPATFLVSLIYTFMIFCISFSAPRIGECSAVLGPLAKSLFVANVFVSICLSTVSLNLTADLVNEISRNGGGLPIFSGFNFNSLAINYGFIRIPGDVVSSYMCLFLSLLTSITNGALPFLRKAYYLKSGN